MNKKCRDAIYRVLPPRFVYSLVPIMPLFRLFGCRNTIEQLRKSAFRTDRLKKVIPKCLVAAYQAHHNSSCMRSLQYV